MTAAEAPLAWMRSCSSLFLSAVDPLPDDAFDAPTALPGWSRRHVLAHVTFNAEALRRLTAWAATGQRTPMYASPEQRSAEIAEGATWSPETLRRRLRESAAALGADLDALDASSWQREVVTAQGRTVPATEIPWMRTREVAVHAVDLNAGIGFERLPVEACEALVADVARWRSAKQDGPALELVTPAGRTWSVSGGGQPATVEGSPAELARWLTGRGAGDLVGAPDLGPWI